VFLTHCCSGDQIKKNEMGGECSAYGDKISANRVSVGNLRERDHLGDPGVGGRIILRWICRKLYLGAWTGSSWLRIGTGGGAMSMR
jgi:hypothetical protein